MSSGMKIPAKTAQKLRVPAAPGLRHTQMTELILPLLGAGLTPSAIFTQFRAMYGPDLPNREIWAIINWGVSRNLVRTSNFGGSSHSIRGNSSLRSSLTAQESKALALRNAERLLNGFRVAEADLWEASPVRLPDNWQEDGIILLSQLYSPEELVCINVDYVLTAKAQGGLKAVIIGPGETRTVADWIYEIQQRGSPGSEAGAWIRLNPLLTRTGAGKVGAHIDRDVNKHAFVLVESDCLSIELQLSLLSRLPLPIAALVTSGDTSIHAWLRIDAGNSEIYRAISSSILAKLKPFGFDPGNKNASRYGRLPGVLRAIRQQNDDRGFHVPGAQRLLYLDPWPKGRAIFS
jgi:hypothetical protein